MEDIDVYLIRHGESEGNRLAVLQGCKDYPLSKKGEKQAESLGKAFRHLALDYIYTSDLSRAHKTATMLKQYQQVAVTETPILREVYLGPLQGKTRREIYEEYPQLVEKSLLRSGLPGTETDEQLTKRCEQLMQLFEQMKSGEVAAAISHGGFLTIFLTYVLAREKWGEIKRLFTLDNTGVTKLSWRNGKLTIPYINRIDHLRSDAKVE